MAVRALLYVPERISPEKGPGVVIPVTIRPAHSS
jgi:hypothetical protein